MPRAVRNVSDFSPLENLADIICASAGARLTCVEKHHGKTVRIHFAPRAAGDVPTVSLPIEDFNPRNVRLELQKFKIQSVEGK